MVWFLGVPSGCATLMFLSFPHGAMGLWFVIVIFPGHAPFAFLSKAEDL